jgi:hypothetical protein
MSILFTSPLDTGSRLLIRRHKPRHQSKNSCSHSRHYSPSFSDTSGGDDVRQQQQWQLHFFHRGLYRETTTSGGEGGSDGDGIMVSTPMAMMSSGGGGVDNSTTLSVAVANNLPWTQQQQHHRPRPRPPSIPPPTKLLSPLPLPLLRIPHFANKIAAVDLEDYDTITGTLETTEYPSHLYLSSSAAAAAVVASSPSPSSHLDSDQCLRKSTPFFLVDIPTRNGRSDIVTDPNMRMPSVMDDMQWEAEDGRLAATDAGMPSPPIVKNVLPSTIGGAVLAALGTLWTILGGNDVGIHDVSPSLALHTQQTPHVNHHLATLTTSGVVDIDPIVHHHINNPPVSHLDTILALTGTTALTTSYVAILPGPVGDFVRQVGNTTAAAVSEVLHMTDDFMQQQSDVFQDEQLQTNMMQSVTTFMQSTVSMVSDLFRWTTTVAAPSLYTMLEQQWTTFQEDRISKKKERFHRRMLQTRLHSELIIQQQSFQRQDRVKDNRTEFIHDVAESNEDIISDAIKSIPQLASDETVQKDPEYHHGTNLLSVDLNQVQSSTVAFIAEHVETAANDVAVSNFSLVDEEKTVEGNINPPQPSRNEEEITKVSIPQQQQRDNEFTANGWLNPVRLAKERMDGIMAGWDDDNIVVVDEIERDEWEAASQLARELGDPTADFNIVLEDTLPPLNVKDLDLSFISSTVAAAQSTTSSVEYEKSSTLVSDYDISSERLNTQQQQQQLPNAPVTMNWSTMKVADLRAELRLRGLPTKGRKQDLVAALEAFEVQNMEVGNESTPQLQDFDLESALESITEETYVIKDQSSSVAVGDDVIDFSNNESLQMWAAAARAAVDASDFVDHDFPDVSEAEEFFEICF